MTKKNSSSLGTEPISKLLVKQAVPASIGILVMSLNIIVDTIFLGNWIGGLAISAVTTVLPFTFFIAAIGLSVGIGGGSVLSRALGSGDDEKALVVFGNMLTLTFLASAFLAVSGLLFPNFFIDLLGADDSYRDIALTYYRIVLYGIVMLALCMMGNTVIRAEGKPKFAMYAMLIPSVGNILMDYLLIYVFDFGMEGAAWATFISYALCFTFILWFFIAKSELRLTPYYLKLKTKIVREISSLSFVTLARQATISILTALLIHVLNSYGDALDVSAYGIIRVMLMFALFPVIGVTQGFMPIAGYNHGAAHHDRVRETIRTSILYAGALALGIFILIMVLPKPIVSIFVDHEAPDANAILNRTPNALRWVFAATPIIVIQLIGSAYFQAIGKAIPALLLSLTKQGFFLIPLILILPKYYGVWGVWISFPIADVFSTIVTAYFLNREVKKTSIKEAEVSAEE